MVKNIGANLQSFERVDEEICRAYEQANKAEYWLSVLQNKRNIRLLCCIGSLERDHPDFVSVCIQQTELLESCRLVSHERAV